MCGDIVHYKSFASSEKFTITSIRNVPKAFGHVAQKPPAFGHLRFIFLIMKKILKVPIN